MQAETTIYFVVWWVLCEYSSFDHFPETVTLNGTDTLLKNARVYNYTIYLLSD